MPYCRNCGARITKFEKDICPVCGQKVAQLLTNEAAEESILKLKNALVQA